MSSGDNGQVGSGDNAQVAAALYRGQCPDGDQEMAPGRYRGVMLRWAPGMVSRCVPAVPRVYPRCVPAVSQIYTSPLTDVSPLWSGSIPALSRVYPRPVPGVSPLQVSPPAARGRAVRAVPALAEAEAESLLVPFPGGRRGGGSG